MPVQVRPRAPYKSTSYINKLSTPSLDATQVARLWDAKNRKIYLPPPIHESRYIVPSRQLLRENLSRQMIPILQVKYSAEDSLEASSTKMHRIPMPLSKNEMLTTPVNQTMVTLHP